MMKPNLMTTASIMLLILITTLMTTKTSIMCINLTLYTLLLSTMMSMKINLSPIPFITFLTIIGGLMIIFLYLAATMWTKKENLTLKNKILIFITLLPPLISPTTHLKPSSNFNSNTLLSPPFSSITIMLITFLMILLILIIKIHMKTNSTFRRKLKIWN